MGSDAGYAENLGAIKGDDYPSVLNSIDGEIERLAQVIDQAGNRLYSVLAPEYATSDRNNDPAPIESKIRQTQRSLSAQIQRLIELLDRVEV